MEEGEENTRIHTELPSLACQAQHTNVLQSDSNTLLVHLDTVLRYGFCVYRFMPHTHTSKRHLHTVRNWVSIMLDTCTESHKIGRRNREMNFSSFDLFVKIEREEKAANVNVSMRIMLRNCLGCIWCGCMLVVYLQLRCWFVNFKSE